MALEALEVCIEVCIEVCVVELNIKEIQKPGPATSRCGSMSASIFFDCDRARWVNRVSGSEASLLCER